jgi:hypothetical protein
MQKAKHVCMHIHTICVYACIINQLKWRSDRAHVVYMYICMHIHVRLLLPFNEEKGGAKVRVKRDLLCR